VEGGIKYEPRFLPRSVRSLATLAVFDLHQDNVLIADPQMPTEQEQIGKVHVEGVELEDVTRISERLTVNFAYSHLFSKGSPSQRFGGPDTATTAVGTFNPDPPLPLTPRDKASLLVDYTFADGPLKGFGIGGGVRYTGETFGDTAGEWRDPSYVLWDGLAHYNFGKWRLQVNASNLLNRTYVVQCSSYSACYYGVPRDVTASLTRAF
jgi:iron complex outermembrane recepter protein